MVATLYEEMGCLQNAGWCGAKETEVPTWIEPVYSFTMSEVHSLIYILYVDAVQVTIHANTAD